MKKKLCLILCLAALLCLGGCSLREMTNAAVSPSATPLPTMPPATMAPLVTPTPSPIPTPVQIPALTPVPTLSPAPTPAPTPIPTPAPTMPPSSSTSSAPRVTKDPTSETVNVGGKAQFVTRYENAIWAEWHFVSPDGTRDLDYIQAGKEFTTLKIIDGYGKDLTLDNIPAALNGWKVYCRFSNNSGAVKSGSATITVRAATGTSTPTQQQPVTNSALPRVTKDPTSETVNVGGRAQFVTRYENAIWAEWHFVSPDGTRDLDYIQAGKEFTTLKIIDGYGKDLTLESIPAALNGWRVYCRFSNNAGAVKSGSATITVSGTAGSATVVPAQQQPATNSALPLVTKDPTSETVAVGGKAQFVTRYQNAIYAEWHFVSPDGTRDLDYVQAGKEFTTMKITGGYSKDLTLESIPAALNGWRVYCRFSNNAGAVKSGSATITVSGTGGATVISPTTVTNPTGRATTAYNAAGASFTLSEYSDGTWRTAAGVAYYLGTDGVFRSSGSADLYTTAPQTQAQSTGQNILTYGLDGSIHYLTRYTDNTYRTGDGVVYTLGQDGIMRSSSGVDLYTYYPFIGN